MEKADIQEGNNSNCNTVFVIMNEKNSLGDVALKEKKKTKNSDQMISQWILLWLQINYTHNHSAFVTTLLLPGSMSASVH